ncbi:hypothetical protein A3Q56_00393 [Intoshia linei]|uniref:Ras-related protein Rab-5A n=1 Tax=Intoshia linei TaxID=1819745 RepID=A0A177BDS2_9BILA|nr:hypothetical protein A3Q56_00393 [Intoshia linei]
MSENTEVHFKLVLLGESAVGKSSIVIMFDKETFTETTESTVGAAFFTKLAIVEGRSIKYDSFERAKTWIEELHKQAATGIIIALCGNKNDLEDEREVETRAAALYAESENIIFMETSSKTNHNITEIFYEIAKKIPSPKVKNAQKNKSAIPTNNKIHKTIKYGCCSK